MAALPLLTALLLAQSTSSDSLPFHKGQWAAQFQGGTTFASLGFLKFRSRTRALLFDIRVQGGHGEQSRTDSSGTHFGGLASNAQINLRFGWRRYHPNGPNIAGHYSFGFIAGFSHDVGAGPGSW